MTVTLLHGDCLDLLPTLPAESVDSVVCDPPYGLGFMGTAWDSFDTDPVEASWSAKGRNQEAVRDPSASTPGGRSTAGTGFRKPNPRCGKCGRAINGRDTAKGFKVCHCESPDRVALPNRDAQRFQTWCEQWAREVYRVLKPGGYLAAFSGTRTQHRMVCAIEDAGFEIRDTISNLHDGGLDGPLLWVYASGFPKSSRVNRDPRFCQCGALAHSDECIDPAPSPGDRICTEVASCDGVPLRANVGRSTNRAPNSQDDCRQDRDSNGEQLRHVATSAPAFAPLQQYAPEHIHSCVSDDARAPESSDSLSQARYTNHRANKGSTRQSGENVVHGDIQGDRTSPADMSDRADHTLGTSDNSASADYAPGFPRCQMCGKPNADGFGTALKPAVELICLARKPLSESGVAANVLKHGVGALNIDGCRVATGDDLNGGTYSGSRRDATSETWQSTVRSGGQGGGFRRAVGDYKQPAGRWPANVCHSGDEEVLEAFARFGDKSSPWVGNANAKRRAVSPMFGLGAGFATDYRDTGTAARFFKSAGYTQDELRFMYCGKASKADRMGTTHPTTKPTALISWLATLVTPPGGTILDPFAGSGTLAVSASRLGFDAILIEREAGYIAMIKQRLAILEAEAEQERLRLAAEMPLFTEVA